MQTVDAKMPPDSVKPWGIWPPLSSHCFHTVKKLLTAWGLLDFPRPWRLLTHYRHLDWNL